MPLKKFIPWFKQLLLPQSRGAGEGEGVELWYTGWSIKSAFDRVQIQGWAPEVTRDRDEDQICSVLSIPLGGEGAVQGAVPGSAGVQTVAFPIDAKESSSRLP